MSPTAKRWTWNILRILVTAGFIVWVWSMIEFEDQVTPEGELRPGFTTLFAQSNKTLLGGMLAAMLIPFFILSLRWWLLLRGHGFDVPLGRTFFVTYAGLFFNNFLPGAVGGDLAKAILVSVNEERKAALAGTVVLDRVVGLAAMIVMGAVCLTPYVGEFEDPRLAMIIYGLLGGMVLGYLVYFNRTLRQWIKGRLPFQSVLGELDGVFKSARDKKGLVAVTAGLSIIGQSSMILIIYGLARALQIDDVPLWKFFIFEPVLFIITALPISVGGWGVQEKAYAVMFVTFAGMESTEAVALSVLFKLCLIVASVPGGLVFALGLARKRGDPPS